MIDTPALDAWIARQEAISLDEMLKSVSATNLCHRRPEFHQSIRPVKGSIVASPISGRYDPDPDYFFHWLRDSAVVIDTIAGLIDDGTLGDDGHTIIADFIAFSLRLDGLNGRRIADDPAYGRGVPPDAAQFLRPRAELTQIHGDRIRMEPRFNPDGSLDVLQWARPQLDGVALRVLVLSRYRRRYSGSAALERLIGEDLDFCIRHAGLDSFDIWEERKGGDYYTRLLQREVLLEAARAAEARGASADADRLADQAAGLSAQLDGHWSAERTCYRSMAGDEPASDRDVDIAVVLASIHAGPSDGAHSPADARMQASLATLADVFAEDYAINGARPNRAPAMGRYRGDVYVSGGAFYFSTLGAAEFCYRLAGHTRTAGLAATAENRRFLALAGLGNDRGIRPKPATDALIMLGDAFLDTVRTFTPQTGALSEQFDRTSGHQTSVRHLAWSYAAFLTAARARRQARAAMT